MLARGARPALALWWRPAFIGHTRAAEKRDLDRPAIAGAVQVALQLMPVQARLRLHPAILARGGRRTQVRGGGSSVLGDRGGQADDGDLDRGYDLGAVDFLLKPVSAAVLYAKVKALLELDQSFARLRLEAL